MRWNYLGEEVRRGMTQTVIVEHTGWDDKSEKYIMLNTWALGKQSRWRRRIWRKDLKARLGG